VKLIFSISDNHTFSESVHDCMYLLCIRNQGHLDFFKISITYMYYYDNLDNGKLANIPESNKLEANLNYIINSAVVKRISIYNKAIDIWFPIKVNETASVI